MASWNDENYVRVYECVRDGMTIPEVARHLEVPDHLLRKWYRDKPALKAAVERAKRARTEVKTGSFTDYVYRRLPPDLAGVWDRLVEGDDPTLFHNARAADLLSGLGQRAKKQLFVHAFVTNNFNTNEACRAVGISSGELEDWARDDPDFLRMLDRMDKMKKDFVEGSLMARIAEGDSHATIFAARTLLRERGYDPKVTVVHEGAVLHGHVNLDDLPLDVDTLRKLTDAVRAENARRLPRHVEAGPPPAA